MYIVNTSVVILEKVVSCLGGRLQYVCRLDQAEWLCVGRKRKERVLVASKTP